MTRLLEFGGSLEREEEGWYEPGDGSDDDEGLDVGYDTLNRNPLSHEGDMATQLGLVHSADPVAELKALSSNIVVELDSPWTGAHATKPKVAGPDPPGAGRS